MNKKYLKKFSKKYITKHFGLANSVNDKLQKYLGLNNNFFFTKIKSKKQFLLQSKINKFNLINRNLIREKKRRLSFLLQIKNFKGIRHKFNLPVRGQRARTNGKTKKRIKNKIYF